MYITGNKYYFMSTMQPKAIKEHVPDAQFRILWEFFLRTEQQRLCELFESCDTKRFHEEVWHRKVPDYKRKKNGRTIPKVKNEGGGITKVLENGTVFEKCAVNYSSIYGDIEKNKILHMFDNQHTHEIDINSVCATESVKNIVAKILQADGSDTKNNYFNNKMKSKSHYTDALSKYNKLSEKFKFYASGISVIVHPINPNTPSMHFNFRFFQIFARFQKKDKNTDKNNVGNNQSTQVHPESIGKNYKSLIYWFGGGCDLSPCYIFVDLFKQFHNSFKVVCDKYNHLFYKIFKVWCDLYFRIKHRNINRGIGGIYFDNLNRNVTSNTSNVVHNSNKNHYKNKKYLSNNTNNNANINCKTGCKCYSCNSIMDNSYRMIYLFIQECVVSIRKTYCGILCATINLKYDEFMIKWQRICRGRYVEFNLIHDRGTKFGIDANRFKTYRRKKMKLQNCRLTETDYIEDEKFAEQVSDYDSDEHEKIDHVLASLPLQCQFIYKYNVPKGSREYETLQVLKHPKKWVPY